MNCNRRLLARYALAASFGVLGGAIVPALAQPPELVHKDGLLVLPNVRVEAAAVPVTTTGRGTRADAGVRAYRDQQTGQLRNATPEELIIEAAQAPHANDPAAATVIFLPDGRVRALLDESFLSNAVVHRTADGRLVMQCLPGDSQASGWLQQAVSTATEADHDK
jgi:hypothetical protein